MAKRLEECGALGANPLFLGRCESEPAKVREVSGVPVWERSRLVYESWKKRVEKGVKN
jgi:hypothetical protein